MSHKKAILSEPKKTLAATPTNDDARSRRPARERLTSTVLEELWSIWRSDPRVPTVKSRRSWAISRNANPRLVDHWFLRRRTCAKKTGQSIPGGSYDLPLGLPTGPKREQSATPVENELEAIPDLPSDDTLVYPPDGDDLNDIEASSDTIFDEDALTELKRTETPAYKDVPHQPYHIQSKPSSSDLYAAEDRCNDGTSFEDPSYPVCNQGWGKQSNFTCILCSTKLAQGTPDEIPSDSGAMPNSRENLCPRLDFLPNTLSELSAIPFLFRTPRTVLADNVVNDRNTDSWIVIEDELRRLVNDGKLDFSFLDVPHLTSMELFD